MVIQSRPLKEIRPGERIGLKPFFILLIFLIQPLLATDLLQGIGQFDDSTDLDSWTKVDSESYSFSIETADEDNDDSYLQMDKLSTAKDSPNDGLFFEFTPTKVKHITFSFNTSSEELEAVNIRLQQSKDSASDGKRRDVIFFRCGRLALTRLNDHQMAGDYTANKWHKVDIVMNWEVDEKYINLYLDEEFQTTAQPFFFDSEYDDLEHIDQILLYNFMKESSIKLKGLQVCDDFCNTEASTKFSGALRTLLNSFVVILSVLLFFIA